MRTGGSRVTEEIEYKASKRREGGHEAKNRALEVIKREEKKREREI